MGYLSKSVSHQDLLTLVIIAAVSVTPTRIFAGNTIVVGDKEGWTVGYNYKAWVKDKQFHVGDTLVFKYSQGSHNVYKVNKEQYKKCIVPSDSQPMTTGYDTVTLDTPGKKFYICGIPAHCNGGIQKLAINVTTAYV